MNFRPIQKLPHGGQNWADKKGTWCMSNSTYLGHYVTTSSSKTIWYSIFLQCLKEACRFRTPSVVPITYWIKKAKPKKQKKKTISLDLKAPTLGANNLLRTRRLLAPREHLKEKLIPFLNLGANTLLEAPTLGANNLFLCLNICIKKNNNQLKNSIEEEELYLLIILANIKYCYTIDLLSYIL